MAYILFIVVNKKKDKDIDLLCVIIIRFLLKSDNLSLVNFVSAKNILLKMWKIANTSNEKICVKLHTKPANLHYYFRMGSVYAWYIRPDRYNCIEKKCCKIFYLYGVNKLYRKWMVFWHVYINGKQFCILWRLF